MRLVATNPGRMATHRVWRGSRSGSRRGDKLVAVLMSDPVELAEVPDAPVPGQGPRPRAARPPGSRSAIYSITVIIAKSMTAPTVAYDTADNPRARRSLARSPRQEISSNKAKPAKAADTHRDAMT